MSKLEIMEVYVQDLVKDWMKNEPVLIFYWKRFFRSLRLENIDIGSLKEKHGHEKRELLIDIMENWVSEKGLKNATVFALVEILTKENFNTAAGKLKRKFIGPKGEQKAYLSRIRISQTGTSGSDVNESIWLKNQLWYEMDSPDNRWETIPPNLSGSQKFLMTGPEKTWKSDLAREIAKQLHRSPDRYSCIYIRGDNLKHEMDRFMEHCRIDKENRNVEKLFELFADRNWLLLFDKINSDVSANSLQSYIEQFKKVPPRYYDGFPFIIVTSREEGHAYYYRSRMSPRHLKFTKKGVWDEFIYE